MPLLRHLTLSLCLLTIASCDLFPESVSRDDSRIHDLIMAAESVNRVQLGFTPLPTGGTVRWEHRSRQGYDATSAQKRKYIGAEGVRKCEERGGPSLDGGGLYFLRCG